MMTAVRCRSLAIVLLATAAARGDDISQPHVHAGTVALHDSKFQGESVTRAIRAAGLLRRTPRVVFGYTARSGHLVENPAAVASP